MFRYTVLGFISVTLACSTVFAGDVTVHWPQFRGPGAGGVAKGTVPSKWDATMGENIKWKTAIPGLGHSSPIIWGDKLFVTTAISGMKNPELKVGLYGNINSVEVETVHSYRLYCLDKKTGKILWNKEAFHGVPKIKRHTKATHANCTPATNGKYVVAFFGSEGLYCYTMDGELVWKKDLGVLDSGYYVVPDAQWEFAASPVIYQDTVVVQCDVQKNSFLAAYSIKDGKQLWRVARDEVPTWSTPTIYEGAGRTQVLVNGYRHIGGYDIVTGESIWRMTGTGDIPTPTPIVGRDLFYFTSGHGRGNPIYAVQHNATGDVSLAEGEKSNGYVKWSHGRTGNYMQTPLLYGDKLFTCRDNGIQACYDAKTGSKIFKQRLGSGNTGFTASPVAADGKVFWSSEEGDVYVVPVGTKKGVLSINPMGEVLMSTPAISEGHIYFRGAAHVFCVGE